MCFYSAPNFLKPDLTMPRENLFTPDCIRTFTGIYFNVFNPTPEMICIEDIAHALSHQCRFGGHLPHFYSVAQHSLYCAQEIQDKDYALEALMHDASEAYLMDVPRPIKGKLTNYKEIEDKIMRLIADKFSFQWPMPDEVKEIDEQALHTEWEMLMLQGKGTKEHLFLSRDIFLERFKILHALRMC